MSTKWPPGMRPLAVSADSAAAMTSASAAAAAAAFSSAAWPSLGELSSAPVGTKHQACASTLSQGLALQPPSPSAFGRILSVMSAGSRVLDGFSAGAPDPAWHCQCCAATVQFRCVTCCTAAEGLLPRQRRPPNKREPLRGRCAAAGLLPSCSRSHPAAGEYSQHPALNAQLRPPCSSAKHSAPGVDNAASFCSLCTLRAHLHRPSLRRKPSRGALYFALCIGCACACCCNVSLVHTHLARMHHAAGPMWPALLGASTQPSCTDVAAGGTCCEGDRCQGARVHNHACLFCSASSVTGSTSSRSSFATSAICRCSPCSRVYELVDFRAAGAMLNRQCPVAKGSCVPLP